MWFHKYESAYTIHPSECWDRQEKVLTATLRRRRRQLRRKCSTWSKAAPECTSKLSTTGLLPLKLISIGKNSD